MCGTVPSTLLQKGSKVREKERQGWIWRGALPLAKPAGLTPTRLGASHGAPLACIDLRRPDDPRREASARRFVLGRGFPALRRFGNRDLRLPFQPVLVR